MATNYKSDKVKVLIVDGSPTFRMNLKNGLSRTANLEVVGTAADPYEASDKILSLHPDVITLDVDLPRMNGIQFLKKLIPQFPIPCVMVSSSPDMADAVLAGAVDHIKKPGPGDSMDLFCSRLAAKIVVASTAVITVDKKNGGVHISHHSYHVNNVSEAKMPADTKQFATRSDFHSAHHYRPDPTPNTIAANHPPHSFHAIHSGSPGAQNVPNLPLTFTSEGRTYDDRRIIALGASTGGTDALEVVLKGIPGDCPPIVIVQHMPASFTGIFAERLDRNCRMTVREASDGARLRKGLCLVAAGDRHMYLRKDGRGYFVHCEPGEKVSGHCPSVDVLFDSVAETAGRNAVAALLTGMGADGAKGLKKLRDSGAYTIGQDEESCVVYGMPMVAYKLGGCCEQASLKDISSAIMRRC